MIVLRVVLKDFRLLCVIKGSHELVDTKVFSPFFAVHEPRMTPQPTFIDLKDRYSHLLGLVDIELSCT